MNKNFYGGYTLRDFLILREKILKSNYIICQTPKTKVNVSGSKAKRIVIRRTK
jgi:hypothetical protein